MVTSRRYLVYSLGSKKATVGHKNFSFCEQTRHKGLIDASCNWLQSTLNNRGQNKFLRKLRAKIQFLRLLFSSLRYISPYNPHTILKKCATRSTKKYIFIFIYRSSKSPYFAYGWKSLKIVSRGARRTWCSQNLRGEFDCMMDVSWSFVW
jgi:hypothetical protein